MHIALLNKSVYSYYHSLLSIEAKNKSRYLEITIMKKRILLIKVIMGLIGHIGDEWAIKLN